MGETYVFEGGANNNNKVVVYTVMNHSSVQSKRWLKNLQDVVLHTAKLSEMDAIVLGYFNLYDLEY